MILYLVTSNYVVGDSASFYTIGIYNSREKAERACDAYATNGANHMPDVPFTEDFESVRATMHIDSLTMNETYFDRELSYDNLN